MKTSTKLKIIGFVMLIVGAVLIVLGTAVFRVIPFNDPFFGEMPNIAFLIPGVFIGFLSLPVLIIGFKPSLVKFGAKLHSETMEHAGKDISEAGMKTVDVVKPVINKAIDEIGYPAITKISGAVKQGLSLQKVYCKHCGKAIDADSKFCKHCSKQQ